MGRNQEGVSRKWEEMDIKMGRNGQKMGRDEQKMERVGYIENERRWIKMG